MIEYPKIETLYDRDAKFKVDVTKMRLPEFANIRAWVVTEKVDGTNVRIAYQPTTCTVSFAGRGDEAQLHPKLLNYLHATFTPDKLAAAFATADSEVVLIGEGYGPKIQAGANYRADIAVRLFDVMVGPWWLSTPNVQDVASKLGVPAMPVLAVIDKLPASVEDLRAIIDFSLVAAEEGGNTTTFRPEGIVARTEPLLFTQKGERVMWKLKFRDFPA